MLSTLAAILGLKRSLGTGLAVAAMLLVLGPYVQKLTGAKQPVPALQESGAVPASAPMQPASVPGNAQPQETPVPPQVLQQEPQSAPVPAENKFNVLELDEEGFNWQKDWWKYLLMAVATVLLAYMTLKVTNLLFKTAIVALCVLVSMVGSLITAPFVTPHLTRLLEGRLPSFLAPAYLAYALCFLIFYLAITALANAASRQRKRGENND